MGSLGCCLHTFQLWMEDFSPQLHWEETVSPNGLNWNKNNNNNLHSLELKLTAIWLLIFWIIVVNKSIKLCSSLMYLEAKIPIVCLGGLSKLLICDTLCPSRCSRHHVYREHQHETPAVVFCEDLFKHLFIFALVDGELMSHSDLCCSHLLWASIWIQGFRFWLNCCRLEIQIMLCLQAHNAPSIHLYIHIHSWRI